MFLLQFLRAIMGRKPRSLLDDLTCNFRALPSMIDASKDICMRAATRARPHLLPPPVSLLHDLSEEAEY